MVNIEALTLWSAQITYVLVLIISLISLVFKKQLGIKFFILIFLGVVFHTVSIAIRWIDIGHMPVGNSYEMISSNVWGLMVAVLVGYWLLPRVRQFVVVVMPIVIMLIAWMQLRPDDPSILPNSYDTVWLYIHIAFIKLFLGAAFIALGMAIIILLRKGKYFSGLFSGMPGDQGLDLRAYRFMFLALIFDTLGVVSGAIWAQDAWKRYWSWDPLEIWSLITWLSIGLMLHIRATYKTSPQINALLIVAVFIIAFFTFFGIPFVSIALHKGAI